MINSPSQLDIHWQGPYSNELYPAVGYNIQIVNMNSGDVLASVLEHSQTIFVHIFDDEVKYCQILTVNVTAIKINAWDQVDQDQHLWASQLVIILSQLEENVNIFYNLAPHHLTWVLMLMLHS